MGGGRKKKFIDKKAATTYNVVHRSQQDGAFGLEDRPSERVLLAQAPVNAARRARVTRAGFADDGYDYERHLRAGGGGVFVARTAASRRRRRCRRRRCRASRSSSAPSRP